MNLSTRILGTSAVKTLQDRSTGIVLTIGRDTFTRADLAHVECFSFLAAANLSRVLADFSVTSTRDVFDTIPPAALAVPHVGAISLAVLGACFELKRISPGTTPPLEAWILKHRAKDAIGPELVTFHTLKQHAHAAKAARRKRR